MNSLIYDWGESYIGKVKLLPSEFIFWKLHFKKGRGCIGLLTHIRWLGETESFIPCKEKKCCSYYCGCSQHAMWSAPLSVDLEREVSNLALQICDGLPPLGRLIRSVYIWLGKCSNSTLNFLVSFLDLVCLIKSNEDLNEPLCLVIGGGCYHFGYMTSLCKPSWTIQIASYANTFLSSPLALVFLPSTQIFVHHILYFIIRVRFD